MTEVIVLFRHSASNEANIENGGHGAAPL